MQRNVSSTSSSTWKLWKQNTRTPFFRYENCDHDNFVARQFIDRISLLFFQGYHHFHPRFDLLVLILSLFFPVFVSDWKVKERWILACLHTVFIPNPLVRFHSSESIRADQHQTRDKCLFRSHVFPNSRNEIPLFSLQHFHSLCVPSSNLPVHQD